MAAFDSRPRTQWVCDWPAMVVLAVVQAFWSAGVEAAVAAGGVPGFLGSCTEELMGLTDLVGARDACRPNTPSSAALRACKHGGARAAGSARPDSLPAAARAPHPPPPPRCAAS
jgi:hypothetical protein